MSRLLSRLVSESAIYGLGAAASQVVGIILIPIYARELGAANYGVLAILNTTISLSSVIAGLALADAFIRTYLKDATSPAERRRVLATSVSLRVVISATASVVLVALSEPLAAVVLGDSTASDMLVLVGGIVFFDTYTVIPLSYLRAERRPLVYAAMALTRAALGSVLILVLVVGAGLGVRGALIGSLGSAVVTSAIGTGVLLRADLRPRWDGALIVAMLAFSLPLVPAATASWSLRLVDRFLLQAFEGSEAVGIYAAGYTIGLAVNVFAIQPFTLMWASARWDIYREQTRAPQIFAKVATGFTIAGSLAALGAAAFATDVVRLLLTPEFEPARYVVPFSAFSAVLYGLYTLAGTGLTVEGKTVWIATIFGAAAALNIGLNLVLIPAFGLMGAAYSTILGYAALAVATGAMSQRYYRIPWQLVRTGGALGIGFGLGLGALLGPDDPLWRVACFAAYLPILFLLRIIGPGDIRTVRASLPRRS